MSDQHSVHIPVMGTGFTIDTPLRVARYGISSVVSLVDDTLIEHMRRVYSARHSEKYIPIQKFDEDWRARRIREYFNLMDRVVKKQIADLKAAAFVPGSEITRYFELLPETSPVKTLYHRMTDEKDLSLKAQLEQKLRDLVRPGAINANIMTKLDRMNNDRNGEPLPEKFSDALSALRGFADSTVESGIVFSAGLNRRLYSYISEFEGFFADAAGRIRKQIILKVSDYRSAVIQGRFFAKKGIWVSEFRVESGLNCGGHAFAGNGHLMGPILDEFKRKRGELSAELSQLCREALRKLGKVVPERFIPFRLTAQGGIGTHQEDEFLRTYYELESTGWGSPFLLVPEVTRVEETIRKELTAARDGDIILSDVSPLGVPFNTIRTSPSEINKQRRIKEGKPGSPCPLGHLVSNTEFTAEPICTASRQYQSLKLAQLKTLELPAEEYDERFRAITAKACICSELGDSAYKELGIEKDNGLDLFPAVCPGPNIAWFEKTATLEEMLDHIYGRSKVMDHPERPHMFIKELELNLDFFDTLIEKRNKGSDEKKDSDLEEFYANLRLGIDYYRSLLPELNLSQEQQNRMTVQLESCRCRLDAVNSRRSLARVIKPVEKPASLGKSVVLDPGNGEEISVLVASQSGNGRSFARKIHASAQRCGLKLNVRNMATYEPRDLEKEKNLLFIISTYGQGDPPYAAESVFRYLREKKPRLNGIRYSILSLGDKSYVKHCQAGKDLDALLENCGGARIYQRVDCDVDYHGDAQQWLNAAVREMSRQTGLTALECPQSEFSQRHPFMAEVIKKTNLNGPGSVKQTFHLELSLKGSGLQYAPGDACGLIPQNQDLIIEEVLAKLKLTGSERTANGISLFNALKTRELTVLIPEVIERHNEFAQSPVLAQILKDPTGLKDFLFGRDFADLQKDYPFPYSPDNLLKVLRPVAPRLYSIASSQRSVPDELHLLVSALRYEYLGRSKKGVASGFVADNIETGTKVPIFIRPAENFRLPPGPEIPSIMVGPGTGLAPFRAFLQERKALGWKGNTWLFFGNPNARTDYIYQSELRGYLEDGTLSRLTVAFSRDQAQKIYVQHRILEHSAEIFKWLENGAAIHVSGALRMGAEVFDSFVEVVRRESGRSLEEALAYVKDLRLKDRYFEDVY